MRRICIFILLLILCTYYVGATDAYVEPDGNELIRELPQEAQELVEEADPLHSGFFDAAVNLFVTALGKSTDGIRQGLKLSGTLLIIVLLCSICTSFGSQKSIASIIGVLGIYGATLGSLGSMIQLSGDTISQLKDYSALLLPVMASAMAISGCPVTAGGLHALTALFAQLLMVVITKILMPGVYLFLALAAGEGALQNALLGELREFVAWVIEKVLRILLYVFTTFLSLTGVISGRADGLAVKTAKAAVSGMVPLVGSILSDASETLLTGAAMVKNTIGVVGMISVLGITVLPFLRVGIQYLIMKITAACSGAVALKEHTSVLKHITTAMGMLLAMTGTCSALLLISGVCYLKVSGI